MIRIADPQPDDPFEYDGRALDHDAEMQFEHRRYDPTVGRWLSEDPIGFADCNVPCYVGNSPINAADPSQI